MTKKEAHKRFYDTLTLEEKGDHNKLPDFVRHICLVQPTLTPEQTQWARSVGVCQL